MSIKVLVFAVAAALAVGVATPGTADGHRLGAVVVEVPWARATPTGASVGAGYMTVRNEGDGPVRLTGGSAPFAGRVEIHEMAMDEGVMRMRALDDGLEIPPGAAVTLEPGGYHVMFMQLREPLVEGERRAATLEFGDAGSLEVEFLVRGMAARNAG